MHMRECVKELKLVCNRDTKSERKLVYSCKAVCLCVCERERESVCV